MAAEGHSGPSRQCQRKGGTEKRGQVREKSWSWWKPRVGRAKLGLDLVVLGSSLSLVGWGQGLGSQLSCLALGKAVSVARALRLTHRIPRLHRLPSLPSGLATRADGPPDTSRRLFFLSSRTATGNTASLFLVSSPPYWTSHIHLQPQLVVSRPCVDALS